MRIRRKPDLSGEPSLNEMLEDPVLQTLMARDGVGRKQLLDLALAVQAKLGPIRENCSCCG